MEDIKKNSKSRICPGGDYRVALILLAFRKALYFIFLLKDNQVMIKLFMMTRGYFQSFYVSLSVLVSTFH